MSRPGLNDRSKKDLETLARRRGIRGWEGMRKDELVRALERAQKAATKPPAKPAPKPARPAAKLTRPAKPAPAAKPAPRPAPKVAAKLAAPPKPVNGQHARPAAKIPAAPPPAPKPVLKVTPPAPVPAKPPVAAKPPAPAPLLKPAPRPAPASPPNPAKDLSFATAKPIPGAIIKDRILLMVPDPFWLHAYWELTHQSVQRAEAALKQDWYGAKPIIRLFDVTSQDTTSTSETPVRDIHVHGGCNNWYIDVTQPPRQYRADIGYLTRRGEFFVLARSNVVTPPKAGNSEALDENWADMDGKKAERILAMSNGFESTGAGAPELKELFEERLRRPMLAPKEASFGPGAALPGSLKKFHFDLNAELIVYGTTDPSAHVKLQNEPIKVRPDGTFTVRYSLTDSRQIIPAVATSPDGSEERTIVLAVERNIKHLDPMVYDQMTES